MQGWFHRPRQYLLDKDFTMLTNNTDAPLILLVEDDKNHADLMRTSLQDAPEEYRLEIAATLGQARAAIDRLAPDLVLTDYRLPDGEGSDLLVTVKGLCPVVLMTSQGNEQVAVDAMKAGVLDYVVKSAEKLTEISHVAQRSLREWTSIQERKRAEEELKRLHKNLEAQVEEMVADLRRKDVAIIQQNRMAAMGEMLGNIAHQWRQPLNTISLIVQSVQLEYDSGTLTSEEMHKDIHEVIEVLQHMSRTIDDFRNFFQEDKIKRDFSISTAVTNSMELVSASLKDHNVLVEIEADDEVTATGYQNEYAQVLLNIISNSCDACLERCVVNPSILIRIARENGRSVLYVRDNCGGIPDDVLPKIFDPYFTTRGPDKGTGIGLYMSRTIIEQNMGGRLTARNVDGGAEFRIEV